MKDAWLTRRRFLGTAATVAAFGVVPRHVIGGARERSPNEKLNIAGIGVGGMGAGNLKALESENIVALCDVDHAYAAQTFQRYPKARTYTDYREMLDQQTDIEAVMIATPDHTHAVISMAAIKAGKHVYCQKPLTHDVYESRRLVQAAKESGVATQMGNQGHSMEGIRSICEWIWDGAIGEIREVDAWCSLSDYPRPPKRLPRVNGSHEMNWVVACKGGPPAGSDFSYSGPLTETCLLGNIAKRVDGRVEWDAANMKVTNLPEANRYVRTEYRAGSKL